jgi:hypothetical protein
VIRGLVAGAGAVLTLALALLSPDIGRSEYDATPTFTVFQLQASNGYRFVALAIPPEEEVEREGTVVLRLEGKRSLVFYEEFATVSRARIEADFGALGRISVTRVPTGRMKTVPRGCSLTKTKRVPAERFVGTIEFHGEEGFAEVSATSVPLDDVTWCVRGGEGGAPEQPGKSVGARLDLEKDFPNGHGLEFDATQQRPGAKTAANVYIQEERGDMEIYRAAWIWAGTGALRYDRQLRNATVRLPAPYSGYGSFHCNAPGRDSWIGNLTVDLPGRSNLPLTGPGFDASLAHPRRTGTEPCL